MNIFIRRCFLWPYFLALLPFISAVLQCHNTTKCQCKEVASDYYIKYVYSCPRNENQLEIEFYQTNIVINCKGFQKLDTEYLLSFLADMPITEHVVGDFIFKECPLPDKPFANIIAAFNITNIQLFKFEYDPKISDTLKPYHFDNYIFGKYLYIQNNNFEISEDAPLNAPSLVILGLTNNSIHTLPGKILNNLADLMTLHLNKNKLTSLHEDIFQFNFKLDTLDIQDNSLSTLPAKLFRNLKKLGQLAIDGNKLTTLPENLFENCSSLFSFSCKRNLFQSLPAKIFEKTTSLRVLDISENPLEFLDDALFNSLTSLSVLSIVRTRLTSLNSKIFANLQSLKNLYLYDNQLKQFEENTFQSLTQIQSIDLDGNPLVMNQNAKDFSPFASCGKLKELRLQNTSLSKLFFNMENNSTALETLVLSFNNIKSFALEDLFVKLLPQQKLFVYLSNNQITTIDAANLENSTKNWCKYQDCSGIEVTFKLTNNPIKCDCDISSLAKHMQKKQTSEMNLNQPSVNFLDVKCQSPELLKNVLLQNIDMKQLKCAI